MRSPAPPRVLITCLIGMALGGACARAQDSTGTLPTSNTAKAARNARPNRDPVRATARGPARKRKPEPETPAVAPVAPAALTISTNPSTAFISVNGNEIESRDANGALRLTGLRPGPYNLIVGRQDYREERRTINLVPGQVENISIVLRPLPGKLNVSPSVAGTEITVRNSRAGSEVGSYAERVSDLEVEPGVYQITVSKSGYKTSTREVTVEPAKSAYLEPLLEPAPVERERVHPDAAMFMQTANDGKYLTVSLTGQSGDSASAEGALDVTLNAVGSASDTRSVAGMLSGFPCQVDFVRIENIAEYSFIEPPGFGNHWAAVVVRVRPKDPRRAIRFAINWKALQSAPATVSGDAYSDSFEPAVVIKKVAPAYPAVARSTRAGGLVVVSVDINDQGEVTSAKAVEGPMLLRQAAEEAARRWKFQPARRGGRPVRTVQSIQFNFHP